MVTPLVRTAIAVLALTSARAELQLSPTISEYELDGIKFKQLAFRDTDKIATYQPPKGWDYSGSANQLTLRPPGKTQAEARVTKFNLPEPSIFDDENIQKLTQTALASAPKGSTNVMLVSQEKNPLTIAKKETFLVTIAYSFYGENYKRSIMFLNRAREQLRFELTSREADFQDLQRAFLGSHFTWQNL